MPKAFLENIEGNLETPRWSGLPDSAGVWAVAKALIDGRIKQPAWVLSADEKEAESIAKSFQHWLKGSGIETHRYPADDIRCFDGGSPSPDKPIARLNALRSLGENRGLIVSSPFGAMHQSLGLKTLRELTISLKIGQICERDALRESLFSMGFQGADDVDEIGIVRWRGDTLTIWPPNRDSPCRVIFFDDEIESLHALKPSGPEPILDLDISPAREAVVTKTALVRLSRTLSERVQRHGGNIQTRRRILSELGGGLWFPGAEDYLPALWPLESPLTNIESCIVFSPDRVKDAFREWSETALSRWENLEPTHRPLIAPELRYADISELTTKVDDALQIGQLIPNALQFEVAPGSTLRLSGADFSPLADKISEWLADGWRVAIASSSPNRRIRIENLLKGRQIATKRESSASDMQRHLVTLVDGTLPCGFIDSDSRLAILSDADLFYKSRRTPVKATKSLRDAALETHADLKIGDHIVHKNHGIGVFLKMSRAFVDGMDRDCLEIEYLGGDKILVPITKIGHIYRYRSVSNAKPKLDKLGGSTWKKRISKVKEKALAMAHELLRLYANRAKAVGREYKVKSPVYDRFTAAFPYVETPDQLSAIEDVEQDLRSNKPMERLLIGDVGFGKTEVSMRAAMAVCLAGRQVAVLCPTTVLAMQHLRTFKQRFADFDTSVAMLSRLQTQAEAKRIKSDVANGKIDILIGTHALLGRTLRFKNLGLVVADEEHRFGVKQKEKLRELSQNNPEYPAEYLAMSATPIPRTLHMALSGIRDVSVIATPPPGRRAVRTMTLRRSDNKIQQQIQREMRRGGQVFFVHNRVQTLPSTAQKIQELVPDAKIRMAHGQMDKRSLEATMLSFLRHETHILVCTSIIENGVDMPNVNTIIIDDAHMLGLSQLYQLRGRVGRSDVRGHCTLMIPEVGLTREAAMRLNTLQRFTDLGSGFAIARSDLELRGSGNLLGKEQSGYIDAIGLETYIDLLEEAVSALKGAKKRLGMEPEIKVPVTAVLPEDYIIDTAERLREYRRLATVDTISDVRNLMDDWERKYGDAPKEALQLGWMAETRIWAKELGLEKVHWLKVRALFVAGPYCTLDAEKVQSWVKRFSHRMTWTEKPHGWELFIRFNEQEAETPFHFLLWCYQQLKKCT